MQDITKQIEKFLMSKKAQFMSGPWGFIVSGMVGLLVCVLIGAYVAIPIIQGITSTSTHEDNNLNTTQNAWYSLTYDDLISLTVVNSSGTLTEGTDYHEDLSGGRINVTNDDDNDLLNASYSYYPDGYITGTPGTLMSHVPTMIAVGIFMLSVLLIGVGGYNIYQERKH